MWLDGFVYKKRISRIIRKVLATFMALALLLSVMPLSEWGTISVKADTEEKKKILIAINNGGNSTTSVYPNYCFSKTKEFYEAQNCDVTIEYNFDSLKTSLKDYSLVIVSVGEWSGNSPIPNADYPVLAYNLNEYAKNGGCVAITFENANNKGNQYIQKLADSLGHSVTVGSRVIGGKEMYLDPASELADEGNPFYDTASGMYRGQASNELITTNAEARAVAWGLENDKKVITVYDIPLEKGNVTYFGDVNILAPDSEAIQNGHKYALMGLVNRSVRSIEKATHEHKWNIQSTAMDTISVYCEEEDGKETCEYYGSSHSKQIKITATDEIYSGHPYSSAKIIAEEGFPLEYSNDKLEYYGILGTPALPDRKAPSDIGKYMVALSFIKNGFDIVSAYAEFRIYSDQLVVEAEDDVEIYDGNSYGITAYCEEAGTTITYGTSPDNCILTESPQYKDAGEYTIYFKATKPGYKTATGSAKLTIKPKPVTATVTAADKVYDKTTQAMVEAQVSLDQLVAGDSIVITNVTGVFEDKNVGTGKTVRVSGVGANVSGTGSSNYEITYPDVQANITPKSITLTDIMLDGQGEEHNVYAWTGSSISPEVSVRDGDASLTPSKDYVVSGQVAALNINSYPLTVSGIGNYKDSVDITWKIVEAIIQAEVKGYTGVYDGIEHGISVHVTKPSDGAKIYYGATEESCNSLSPIQYKNIGTYIIYYRIEADNYESVSGFEFVNITKRDVTVTADNVGKHEGDSDPTLTYQVENVVDGEALNHLFVKRVEGEAPGYYDILVGEEVLQGQDSNPNYNIIFNGGTFTIEAHDCDTTTEIQPTCTDDGVTASATCRICNKSLLSKMVIPKLGHDWPDEWRIVKFATDTEEGLKEKICRRHGCTEYISEIIPIPGPPDPGKIYKEIYVDESAPVLEADLVSSDTELLSAKGIFTELETQAIYGGMNATVWLEIKDMLRKDVAEPNALAMEMAAEKEMMAKPTISYFDANLFKQMENGEIVQIHEPEGYVTVSLVIPEALLNHDRNLLRDYKIIRLHDDEVKVIPGIFIEGENRFIFQTDRFSTYAIAYCDIEITPVEEQAEPEKETPPKLGDMDDRIVIYIMILAGLAMLLAAEKRRREDSE